MGEGKGINLIDRIAPLLWMKEGLDIPGLITLGSGVCGEHHRCLCRAPRERERARESAAVVHPGEHIAAFVCVPHTP